MAVVLLTRPGAISLLSFFPSVFSEVCAGFIFERKFTLRENSIGQMLEPRKRNFKMNVLLEPVMLGWKRITPFFYCA